MDKLRSSYAAEASRTLQFDFSSVSAKLRRAEYDTVDETCADLEDLARLSAQNWDGTDEQVPPVAVFSCSASAHVCVCVCVSVCVCCERACE